MTKFEAENENQELEIVEVEVKKIAHHDLENGNLIGMDDFSRPTDANIIHHLTKIERKIDDLSNEMAGEIKGMKETIGQLDVDLKGNNWAVKDLKRVVGEMKMELTSVSGKADGNRTHLENIQAEVKEILSILKSK